MIEKISVIVPIYKVEEFLDECIQSIVNQTHTNLEIILVDDGSPDNCPDMCDAWEKVDSRIKVIHKSNGGLSDARNAGLRIATGDYIAFVDSDDWISPKMYEIMLHHIKREDADICACGIMACYPDKQRPMNIKSVIGDSKKILSMLYNESEYPVSAWNKLYRRECWKNFEFPVGKICEDAFTTYKLIHRAKKIIQITEEFYFYRIRSNSIMTSKFSSKRMDEEEAWRCNYEFISKYYPKLRKKAFDFYLQRVNNLIHTIPREQRMEFEKEYNYLHKILQQNVIYLLFLSRLSLKYRVKFIIDFIQL